MVSSLGGMLLSQKAKQRTIFVTGLPGVGKTTLLLKLEKHFRERGFPLAGIMTQEVRKNGERVGFRLRDIMSGREGWLARKGNEEGPRIGKYSVVINDLEQIAVTALEAPTSTAEIFLVDEIGPMEMTNAKFHEAISKLLASGKIVIATVKHGSRYQEVERVSGASEVMKIVLTPENRESALIQITFQVEEWLHQ